MKKLILLGAFIFGLIQDLEAQDYLISMREKTYTDSYRLFFLRKLALKNMNDSARNFINLFGSYYKCFQLKITNNGDELFPCCETDSTSYSGMDQYEKNLKKYGGTSLEKITNGYQKMLDSIDIKLRDKRNLKIKLNDTVIQIYSATLEICDCVYGTFRNSNRLYFNYKYLKKITELKSISENEKNEFKVKIAEIERLINRQSG